MHSTLNQANSGGKGHLRELMPALKNKKYFNYGGQGPLPKPSLEAINKSWEEIQEMGPFSNDVFAYISREITKTKELLASMCMATPNQVALTENVTSGCILPLWGLPFKTGDRFLVSDCEHPGVVAACKELAKRKGIFIDVLPIQNLRYGLAQIDELERAFLDLTDKYITPRTRLVVVSHILWNTGQVIPIKALGDYLKSQASQPYLLVDGAQSFGQIAINEEAKIADIYAFTGHKWACGPEGLGGVALSERVLTESQPTLIGWRALKNENTILNSTDNLFHNDGRRFEIATSCIPLLAGLRCSLGLLEKEGALIERSNIIQQKSAALWLELSKIDLVEPLLEGNPPAGLVSFTHKGRDSPRKIVQKLGTSAIWIRDLVEPKSLRACVHVTTDEGEMRSLIEAIKAIKI